MIQVNDERYWLYAAVNPATNRLLHVRLFPTRTQALTEMFLVDSVPWLQATLYRYGLRFQYEKHGNRNVVERIRGVKRRTNQFRNTFSHADSKTFESWLQAFAAC